MAELKDKELEKVDGGIWYKPAPTEASADGMPFPRGSADGLAPDIIIIDEAAPKGWE